MATVNIDMRLGDCLEFLPAIETDSVHCCVTSPPYWGLRDYDMEAQLGLEKTPEGYVGKLARVFREVQRVLREDGTLWLNLGDSYAASVSAGDKTFSSPEFNVNRPSRAATKTAARTIPSGLKPKDLVGIPWRVAFALQADGWYLRSDVIWHKPNPMPESVTDRPTKSHEYIFLLTKNEQYYYDAEAIKEPAAYAGQSRGGSTNRYEQNTAGMDCREYSTRNKRSVWTVKPAVYKQSHFATFPEELITPCILAGCPEGGTVLDPFLGSGTTAKVAQQYGRNFVGCELNPQYLELARERFKQSRLFA